MAYLIHGTKHPVIYCCNYRVGSTALGTTLMDMGATKLGSHHDPPEEIPEDALVVEAVRHHCDVLVSWWFWRNSTNCFNKFVEAVLDGHHTALKPDAFYNNFGMTNYILRYETLEFEWETLCCIAGLEYRELKVKPSKRPPGIKWHTLFNRRLQDRVFERYGEEMERLGYGPN